MNLNVKRVLNDLDGLPIPHSTPSGQPMLGTQMTLADVMTQALLAAPHPPGSQYPADQSVKRYELALEIAKARKDEGDGHVEVSAEMASTLKTDINRLYGPIVAGQVLPWLDGK